jgi:hypothetical protein
MNMSEAPNDPTGPRRRTTNRHRIVLAATVSGYPDLWRGIRPARSPTRCAGACLKGYGSSWIFEPRLTSANALRRVQQRASPWVTQVRPQLEGRVCVEIPAHGHDGVTVRGVVADCNSGAMAASLPGATRPTRLPSRQPPRLPRCLLRRCGYGVAPGRTLAAWGPSGLGWYRTRRPRRTSQMCPF